MLSGRWAAETLADCAAWDDYSRPALQAHATRVLEALSYDMALSRMIVQLIRNRGLNPIWLQVLRIVLARARVDPSYADATGGVMAGLVPARSAMNRSVVADTLQ